MPHVVDPTLRPLTVKIYAALLEAWVDHGMAPSQTELRDACLCSTTTVMASLKELKRKGYIAAPKFQRRGAKPTDLTRTISREPIPPWAELKPPKKFFELVERTTNR